MCKERFLLGTPQRLLRCVRIELELPQALEQRYLVDVVGFQARELVHVGGEHVGCHAVWAPGCEAGDQLLFERVHLPLQGVLLLAQEQNSAVASFEFGRICSATARAPLFAVRTTRRSGNSMVDEISDACAERIKTFLKSVLIGLS